MKTIYQRIHDERNAPSKSDELSINLSSDLSSVIVSKLANLLHISCGIDLSSYASPFTNFCVILDEFEHPELSYDFPYGKAYVCLDATTKGSLKVSFSFSNKVPVKLYNDMVVYLDVDHDMRFENVSFRRSFEYKKLSIVNCKSIAEWAVLIIDTCIDNSLKKKNHIVYENHTMYSMNKDCSIILCDEGLNSYFMSTPDNFDELLFIFLNLYEKHPIEFHDVFLEQMNYVDVIVSHEEMVQFLNMFYTQYSENKDLLISNISMLEMRVI